MPSFDKYNFGSWKSYLDDPCLYCDGSHFERDCRFSPWRKMKAPAQSYWEYICSLCGGREGHWSDCKNAPPFIMLKQMVVLLMSLLGFIMRRRKSNIPGPIVWSNASNYLRLGNYNGGEHARHSIIQWGIWKGNYHDEGNRQGDKPCKYHYLSHFLRGD